jgi:amino acid adenylation domain-containing protein
MSTFKLSKNQEFHFLKSGGRYLSLLYSFNADMDIDRLKDACAKGIKSVDLLNYKLVDVSAMFPLQTDGIAELDINVTFDPEFTVEKFYSEIDNNEAQINPYQHKPIALAIVISNRIYLKINVSCVYFDNYSTNRLVQRIIDIYYNHDVEFEEEIDYFSYSEWQNEILDEEVSEENFYNQRSKEKGADCLNSLTDKTGFPLTKMLVEDIWIGDKKQFSQDQLAALTLQFIGNYIKDKNFSVGLLPYFRNHDILNETLGLINTSLPVYYSHEECSNLEYTTTLVNESATNRDNFNYTYLTSDFDNIQLIYLDVPDSSSFNQSGARFEAFVPSDEIKDLKVLFIVSDQQILLRAILPSTQDNHIPTLFMDQFRNYVKTFCTSGTTEFVATSKQIEYYEKNTCDQPQQLTDKNHSNVVSILTESFVKYAGNDCLANEDTYLTFAELDSVSNQMAHFLSSDLGVKKGDMVALMLPRSINQIIALLGIIKTGACFITIDSGLPEPRKQFIIEDANIRSTIDLSVMDQFNAGRYPSHPVSVSLDTTDPFYCIYTSGSTGLPKGCLINNENILNYLSWIGQYWKGNEQKKVGYFTTLSFDFTITSLLGSLLSGSCLCVINEEADLSESLNQIVSDNGVGVIKITPAHIGLLGKETLQKSNPKVFIVGGEALSKKQIEHLRNNKDCQIYNEYGPTEATVGCIVHLVDDTNMPYIGKPIPGVKVLIVNESNQPLPIGCIGEILLSGKSVIKEYLKTSQNNASKFTNISGIDGLFYRTGDIGRLTGGGIYEYHGRTDDQVKLNGYRIELAEVEANIKKIEYVDDAAVVIHSQNDNKQLIAFWVSNHEEIDFTSELKKFLPLYMIPSRYIKLNSLPLNHNGKIDKLYLSQLPLETESSIITLDTKSESLIAEAIAAELKINVVKIGKESNFISLGGDSIKAIQVLATLRKNQFQISLQDLMGGKPISFLARNLRKINRKASQTAVSGIVEMTPIQSLFCGSDFITGLPTEKSFYNQSQLLDLRTVVTPEDVHEVMKKLMEHHDMLRATFQWDLDGCSSQVVLNVTDIDAKPEVFDISANQEDKQADEVETICEKLKSQLQMQHGPLVKSAYIKAQEKTYFFITAHHLITDLVSWKIILEDIDLLLTQISNKSRIQLPLKTDSYMLWSNFIQSKAVELKQHDDTFFWNNILSEKVNDISFGNKGFSLKNAQTKVLSVPIAKVAKIATLTEGQIYLNTQSVLLRSLGDALAGVFGAGTYRIHLESHGRNTFGDIDLSRTVGWFTSTYPIVVSCVNERSMPEDYISLGYTLSNLPMDGLSFGILNQSEQLRNENTVSWVEFNYLGDLVDNAESFANFSISDISHGYESSRELTHMADFSVLAYQKNKQIVIEFNYNADVISEQKMELLKGKVIDSIDYFIADFENNNQQFLLAQPTTTKGIGYDAIKRLESQLGEPEDILLLSPLQSGIYFHALAEEDDRAYFWQYAYKIKDSVDVDIFRETFNELLKRHQVLRTVFRNDVMLRPVQIVLKEPKIDLRFEDLCDLNLEEQDAKLADIRTADIREGFDIANGPLIRLYLIKLRDDVFYRIWSNHHLLLDGWSTQIVLKEFEQIYFELSNGREVQLPDLPSFSSYIDWYQSLPVRESQQYWQQYLKGYEYSLSLPGDLMKDSKEYMPSDFFFKIDPKLTTLLNDFATSASVTLNALVQCMWGLIIARQNQVNDVVFGSVISGRSSLLPDADKMVGMLINTIPNRIRFESDTTFKSLLNQMFKTFVEGEPHHYLPLFEIQKQSASGKDLIQNVITYVNYPDSERTDSQSLGNSSLRIDEDSIRVYETTQFDINILVYHGEGLEFNVKYNSAAYSKEAISALSGLWHALLNRILSNEDIDIQKLLSVTDQERSICLTGPGIGENQEIPFHSVLDFLEVAFLKRPNSVCVVYGTEEYTYAEFWNESSRFAQYLNQAYYLHESDFVGICMPRSAAQLIALLGVMKAGSAYVPFDISWPKERIDNLVENANLKVVITEDTFVTYRQWLKDNVIQSESQSTKITGVNTVYCIYTSGSTGKPKGCTITHANLLNYLTHANSYWTKKESLEAAYFSPISFDFTITSILGCWLNQGKLIVYSEDENVYDIVNEIVANPSMDVIKLAPAHVNLLEVDILTNATPKTFILGGEALTTKHINKLNKNKKCSIINEYGPTEATVGCITHRIDEDEIPFIGKPICNTQIFLLNEEFELVPYGAAGEIHIAGASVGKGYLGMNEVTQTRFVANPFGEGLIYKTGDLARWTFSGKLHYLGRNDNQVKINGFRVELDEIVNTAEKHHLVQTFYTVVDKNEQDISKLLGYYTGSIDELDLSEYLSTQLPDYMVPSIIQKVDYFELTVNGKIDKEKLPKITPASSKSDTKILSSSEELLKRVWSEVLMIEEDKIHPNSNFIKLGGDSIKAIRLVVRMREYGYKLHLKSILSNPDLAATAKEIESSNTSPILVEESLNGSFVLSPIQELFLRNHFIKGSLTDKSFYNQSRILKFNKNLTSFEVKQAIVKLMAHHDALRLKFDFTNPFSQEFDDESHPKFFFNEFYPKDQFTSDLLGYIQNHGISEVKQQISLNAGLLLAVGLYQGKGESFILISIHHLVVDQISWEFITKDFKSILEDRLKDLTQKTHSYKKYCTYLTGLNNHSSEQEAMSYWSQIENENEINLRRTNKDKGSFASYETRNIDFSKNDSNVIMSAIAASASIDIQVLCLSALTESLGCVFGEGKFRFHLEGHGRDLDDSIDVSRTVGWFTSITPLLTEKKSEAYGLQDIMELRDRFNRQKNFLHFYRAGLHSDIANNSQRPKSWIEFNFLGSSVSDLEASMVTDETGNESSLNLANMADLIFVGELRNGILNFKLTFEQQILTEDEIANLCMRFQHELMRLASLLSEIGDEPQADATFQDGWADPEIELSLQNQFGEIENVSKLTPLQLGMYFLLSSNSDAKAYHWQYGCELQGELDVKKYKESFGELVHRHGILKTIIRDDIAADPLQIQLKIVKPDFRFMDVSLNDEEYNEGFIKKLIQEDLDEKFDLSEKPPLRLTLVKLNDDHFYRLWSNHHIILDGWSTGIVLDELDKIYSEKLKGGEVKQESKSDFSDYLSWLDSYDVRSSKLYWQGYLKGIKNAVEVKADKVSLEEFVHKDYKFNISNEITLRLKELLVQNQVTLNVAIHFFWALILSKHSNDRDIVFGSVVSGRPPEIEGVDQIVGMFINTIPVRLTFNEGNTLLNQLKQFQDSFYENLPHHYVNLGDITSATIPGKSLINNILTFEKESDESFDHTNGIETHYLIKNEYVFESTNFNLNFIVKPINGLSFTAKYNFANYSEEKISKLALDWNAVISAFLDRPDGVLQDVVLGGGLENNAVAVSPLPSTVTAVSSENKALSTAFIDNSAESQKYKWIERLKELYAEVLDCAFNEIEVSKGFFEMGGHSINAIKILSILRKEFGLKVTYSSFARFNKINDLASMLNQSDKDEIPEIIHIEESESYDVSPSQRRMWLLNQLENSGNAYNVYWGYRIHGAFDKKVFEKAILKLIERHEILRTIYTEDSNGTLKQVVLNYDSPIFKISHQQKFKSAEEKSNYIADIVNKPFDLRTGPVIRNYILDDEETTEWFIVLHHIVTDDQTFVVLTKEISLLYNQLIEGKEITLTLPEFQYKDYASWFNKLNSSGIFKKEISFWKKKLEGKVTSLNIPTEVLRPKTYLNKGKSSMFELDAKAIDNLRIFAKNKNTTLFTVLLTYLKIVLKAYSNQESITIGTPLSGRILTQLEGQVGYFLNAVPILTEVHDDDLIEGLLKKVNTSVYEAYAHGNISFDDLINELDIPRDMSRNPIFDVWADYHHNIQSDGRGLKLQDCSIEEIKEDFNDRPTKFDLTFIFIDDGQSVDLHFEYNTSIYSDEIAKNIISSYMQVLLEYNDNVSEKIGNVNCISAAQKFAMNQIFESNDVYNHTGTIINLFYNVIDNYSDHIAVSTKNTKLTYNELNDLSNALAELLRQKHHVLKGDWIAISLPRNEMVLVSIWAIIKLGAAYVPLEMELPDERKSFIINDAQVKLVIDEDFIEEFLLMRNLYSSSNIYTEIEGSDAVYCMYTSGSTGTPKAVKISHDNLYSSNIARQKYYGNTGLRSFALYSYSFDSSVNLFFDTILTGGNLYLYDTPKLDLYQVWNEMNINKSEILTIPPSLYDLLLDHGDFIHLKKVIVAGEECLSSLVSKHFKNNPEVELYNEYGPTECTVWSLVYKISKGDENKKRIPIGLPITFANILILNKNQQIVPSGAFGELYISGPGVAEQYKGNFTLDDSNGSELKKYYKTGDLVRINSDSLVEYISRVDNQLKVRGYRVETGEIENSIKGIEGVTMVHVTHTKDASNQTIIIAYYTGSIEASDLKTKLQQKMQDYMIPAFMKKLDTIPINLNGKVDEASLPKNFSDLIEKGSLDIAQDTLAYELSELWADAMGIDRSLIYLDSDFFSLGGNSLKAIKLNHLIVNKYNFKMQLNTLFSHSQFKDFFQAFELMYKSNADAQSGYYLEI